MKQIKVANFIAKLLVERGITQNFTVTGGGAMHLNDAFGHQPGMFSLYQHHEQACAMAAESYARVYNRPALLCVTSGPGGTNAITGVLGAWLDSLPMLVISGQVRYDNTARWSGVGIRAMGDQEFDIQRAVSCMSKYSEMMIEPMRVRYVLEKCLFLMQTGRPGPCWLDIPVNIQGSTVDESELCGFDEADYLRGGDGWGSASTLARERGWYLPEDGETAGREQPASEPKRAQLQEVLERIRASKRPVFYTGNGIRIAGAEQLFLKLAERLNIPVVTGWNGEDVIPDEHPLYVGRPGGRGDRPGNLAVQNADLIFSVGSRLSIRQVGYNFKTWARAAYVIVNDIDAEELKKPSVHIDLALHTDALSLMKGLLALLDEAGVERCFEGGEGMEGLSWLETCHYYKETYPVVTEEHLAETSEEPANVYAVVKHLSSLAAPGQLTVVGNGSACVAGGQAWEIKTGSRFISQSAVASMGYDLPAAIGAWAAVHGPDAADNLAKGARNPHWKGREEQYPDYAAHDILCLTGDGSLQMNLQELQTIIHHRMRIKLFVINNQGYHSIRQTQKAFFGEPLVGIGADSGVDGHCDLSFPDLSKLAAAYGFPFLRLEHNAGLREEMETFLSWEGPAICEIMVSTSQEFLPKSAAKRLPDGSLVSPPLEDLAPFLPEEEMKRVMLIPRIV